MLLLLKCLADNEEGYLDSKRKVRRTDICTFYDKFDLVLCIYIDTFIGFKPRFLRNKAIQPEKCVQWSDFDIYDTDKYAFGDLISTRSKTIFEKITDQR